MKKLHIEIAANAVYKKAGLEQEFERMKTTVRESHALRKPKKQITVERDTDVFSDGEDDAKFTLGQELKDDSILHH